MKFCLNKETKKRRISKLKRLKFVVNGEDETAVCVLGFKIDFSAIDEDQFLEHAIRCIYYAGKRQGEEDFKKRFRDFFDIPEKENNNE